MIQISDFLKTVRAKNWKWYDHFLITMFLGWLLLKYPLRFGSGIVRRVVVPFITPANEPLFLMLIHYLGSIGIWVCVLAICLIPRNREFIQKIFEKFSVKTPYFLSTGILCGASLNAFAIGLATLFSNLTFERHNASMLDVFILLGAMFVQSSGEELLYRGLVYQKLKRGYKSKWIAICGSSLIFGLIHSLNPGVTILSVINLILFGLITALMTEHTGNIWRAIGFHWMWNFTQTIIAGLPNSGFVPNVSLYQAVNAINNFAYNVTFGIEGTVTVLVIFFAFFVTLLKKEACYDRK